jgi:hypothetical protein
VNDDIREPRSLRDLLGDLWARGLFYLTLVISGGLIALVLLAPLLDNAEEKPEGGQRVLAVFARDGALRRTALASAAGLAVTACVFFRTPRAPRPPRVPRSSSPSGPVVGA